MQMIGKHDIGFDLEGVTRADLLDCSQKQCHRIRIPKQQTRCSVRSRVKKYVAPEILTRRYRMKGSFRYLTAP